MLSSFYSGKLLGLGFALSLGGLGGFYSYVSHEFTGAAATATLLETKVKCRIEFQLVATSKPTQADLVCPEAEAFRRKIGLDKVKLERNEFFRLKYNGVDGAGHEVEVAAAVFPQPHGRANGDQFPVVYDPAHPDDVRRPFDWRVAAVLFVTGVFGLLALWAGYLEVMDPHPAEQRQPATAPQCPPRQADEPLRSAGRGFGRRGAV